MALNDAGKMVDRWRHEIENKFPDIDVVEFVVMPNHIHGMICIAGRTPVAGQTHRSAPTDRVNLQKIIQWYKTMTTNEYIRNVKQNGWVPFKGKLWQRNYYEHIIRSEKSLEQIREYIMNNPVKWDSDELNPHKTVGADLRVRPNLQILI